MKTLFASIMLLLAHGFSAAADAPAAAPSGQSATAIFAGGCFWCTEADFEKVPGVIEAESGYTGGQVKDPSYEQVSAGKTGHTEAVRVRFDPAKVSYAQLVEHYWRTIDPTVVFIPGIFGGTAVGRQSCRLVLYVKEAEPRSNAGSPARSKTPSAND